MVQTDLANNEPAYLCGRLLSLLEEIQYGAVGEVGSNVIDRFFGRAATAPGTVFGDLVIRAKAHLGAMRREERKRGYAISLERRMGEIIRNLPPGLPLTLSPRGRATFAVGYYHERQSRFAKSKDTLAANAASDDDGEDNS